MTRKRLPYDRDEPSPAAPQQPALAEVQYNSTGATHALIQGLTMCYLTAHSQDKPDHHTVVINEMYEWVIPQVERVCAMDWRQPGYAMGLYLSLLGMLKDADWITCDTKFHVSMQKDVFLKARIGIGHRFRDMSAEQFIIGPFYKMLILAGHSEVTDRALRNAMAVVPTTE